MVANTDLISAAEYNYSRGLVSGILTSYGYTATAVAVTGGTTIVSAQTSAYQWLALVADMNRCAAHQGTTLTLPSAGRVASGNLVYATDITLFRTAADLLDANRYNIAEASLVTLRNPQRNDTYPGSYWGAAAGSVSHNFTITFNDATHITSFFNAGGKIVWNATRTGGAATLQNSNWETLLNSLGTVLYAYNETKWGASTDRTGNFGYKTTPTASSGILLVQQGTDTASSVRGTFYADNDCTISVVKSATAITFSVLFRDDDKTVAIGANPNGAEWGNYDYVDGLLQSFVKVLRPSGANIDIAVPTYSFTAELT